MTGPTSTRAAGAFPMRRQQTEPEDRAAALFREWQNTLAEVDRLGQLAADIWTRLPERARGYLPVIPADHPAFADMNRPDRTKPIVMAREELEEYGASIEAGLRGHPALERAREVNAARLAVWDEAKAEIDSLHQASGYPTVSAANDAALERLSRLEETISVTNATSLAGIVAKLSIAAYIIPFGYVDQTAPMRSEDRILLSALADAKRLEGKAAS